MMATNTSSEDTSSPQLNLHDQLIQSWLTEASELRKLMNSSKTQTKKNFYGKKFKKLSKDIIAAVASREFVTQYLQASDRVKEREDGNASSSSE